MKLVQGVSFLVIGVCAGLFSACGGGGSSADALAERLTDALDFDGGTVVDDKAPAGSSDPGLPQVTNLEAPGSLTLGEGFVVALSTTFADQTAIAGAVVAVNGSERHISVPGVAVPHAGPAMRNGSTWLLNLAGLLKDDSELRGKSFDIRVALRRRDGLVGGYAAWRLAVREAAPVEPVGNRMDEVSVTGETWHQSGRPAGSEDGSAPQIAGIVLGGTVRVGELVMVTVRSGSAAPADVSAVIVSTPNNPGYKLTGSFAVRAATGGGIELDVPITITDPRLRGMRLVLLWALQGPGGTGLYYPLLVTVADLDPVDGDTLSDGDMADGDRDGMETADDVEESDDEPPPDGDSEPDSDTAADGDTVSWPIFVPIPAGTFTMGSPEGEAGRGGDETQHQVTLTYDFELMATELTQGQFGVLMGYNPSYFTTCDGGMGSTCPVEMVSWYEALKYANLLSGQQGYAECYECTGSRPDYICSLKAAYARPQDCSGYRLPTESEWEYAARAGAASAYFNGRDSDDAHLNCETPFHLTDIAWYCGSANGTTHPVGEKRANPWGLYDMSGNVWEWVWDWYGTYPGSVTDPVGPPMDSARVYRGGDWSALAQRARSAARDGDAPGGRDEELGFRLARTTRRSGLLCHRGICLDPATGFEWQQEPTSGAMMWDDAVAHCRNLDLDGSGWRLPNISELRALVSGCPSIETGGACGVTDACGPCGTSTVCLSASACLSDEECYPVACVEAEGPTDGCYWPAGLAGNCDWHWSSSVEADGSGRYWLVQFKLGYIDNLSAAGSNEFRCVR